MLSISVSDNISINSKKITYRNIGIVSGTSKLSDAIKFIGDNFLRFSFYIELFHGDYVLFCIDELYGDIFSLGKVIIRNKDKELFIENCVNSNKFKVEIIFPSISTYSYDIDDYGYPKVFPLCDGLDSFSIKGSNYGLRILY